MHFPILPFITVSHLGSIVWGFDVAGVELEGADCDATEVENKRLLDTGYWVVSTASCRFVSNCLVIIVSLYCWEIVTRGGGSTWGWDPLI